MCRRPGRKIWRHWAARAAMSPSRCRWQDPRERMNRYTRGQFHCRSCRRQARCGCNRLTGLHSGYTFRAYPPSLWPAKANLQGSRELVEGGVALFPYRRKAPAHCPSQVYRNLYNTHMIVHAVCHHPLSFDGLYEELRESG